ncbi:MAG: hypothetical protein ABIM50_12545, partial [Novosphingobium sp.]
LLTTITRMNWGIWTRDRLGFIPKGSFARTNVPTFMRMLNTPGGMAWWNHRKQEFPDDFVRDVDKLIAGQPTAKPLP